MATSTVTEVTVIPAGKWVQNENGWQYQNNDGSYATNTWQNIDGYWYVFDENSYMVTGWYWSGEEWYYLADNGQMQTGWFTQDGEEYYLDPDTGVMARNTTIDCLLYTSTVFLRLVEQNISEFQKRRRVSIFTAKAEKIDTAKRSKKRYRPACKMLRLSLIHIFCFVSSSI